MAVNGNNERNIRHNLLYTLHFTHSLFFFAEHCKHSLNLRLKRSFPIVYVRYHFTQTKQEHSICVIWNEKRKTVLVTNSHLTNTDTIDIERNKELKLK